MTSRVWRDLRCTVCNTHQGFTGADLNMVKGYEMRYWCNVCQKPQLKEFFGDFYALDEKMQRIAPVFDFEGIEA
jgi:hypothetical protein